MSQRLNEYFAEEAADYLQQLDAILSAPIPPDPIRFLRLTTGVRGSTQMAGADDIASLAGQFEGTARAFHDGDLAWTDEIRDLARMTVREIHQLVHLIDRWGATEAGRIADLRGLWDDLRHRSQEPAQPESVAIESLYYDDAGPHILDAEPAIAAEVVPIGTLLLRGERALQAAVALRPSFEEIARGDALPARPLAELVDELFDLVELGLTLESTEV
jgi:hypothetical protein